MLSGTGAGAAQSEGKNDVNESSGQQLLHPEGQPAISVNAVTHHFERRGADPTLAIEGVSLDIAEGEFVALVGPSGCGKTTLLNLIAGLVPLQDGAIERARAAGHQAEPPGRLHLGTRLSPPVANRGGQRGLWPRGSPGAAQGPP